MKMLMKTLILMLVSAFALAAQADRTNLPITNAEMWATSGVSPDRRTGMGNISISRSRIFRISSPDGKLILKISMRDGEITFGKSVTPNEAAKQLAIEVKRMSGQSLGCPQPEKAKEPPKP